MNNLLQAIGGAMLVCIPISLMFVLPRNHKPTGVWFGLTLRGFLEVWGFSYLIVLLFVAVFFAGAGGLYFLTGAFQ